jgi:hypothetical protein
MTDHLVTNVEDEGQHELEMGGRRTDLDVEVLVDPHRTGWYFMSPLTVNSHGSSATATAQLSPWGCA